MPPFLLMLHCHVDTDTAEEHMSNIQYVEGKVYLRNVHNGIVYEYEKLLARSKNVECFVPKECEIPKQKLSKTQEH